MILVRNMCVYITRLFNEVGQLAAFPWFPFDRSINRWMDTIDYNLITASLLMLLSEALVSLRYFLKKM